MYNTLFIKLFYLNNLKLFNNNNNCKLYSLYNATLSKEKQNVQKMSKNKAILHNKQAIRSSFVCIFLQNGSLAFLHGSLETYFRPFFAYFPKISNVFEQNRE